jgi:hypothetical protein
MVKLYILKDRQVVPVDSIAEWGIFFMKPDRIVAQWDFDNVRVSTVFLGIEHGWSDEGQPIVFETMVFNGPMDGHQERSATWQEAEQIHERVCAEVRAKVLQ